MYQAGDIEVFIFAHNRAAFLRETLECYLGQTVTGFRLVILANGPTPEVDAVSKEYAAKGVDTITERKVLNVHGCVSRCRELASRPITIMAHDDDLIHPAYVETVLKCYNQVPNLNMVLSAMGEWDEEPFSREYHSHFVLLNRAELSAYIFIGKPFAFSSSSYKTEALKKSPGPDFSRFGKVNDVPFMLGVCGDQKAVVLQFPFVKCRSHKAQDSKNFVTGPTAEEWISLDLCHKEIMGHGGRRIKLAHICNSFHRLKMAWWAWCVCEHSKMNFWQYMKLAFRMGEMDVKRCLLGGILHGNIRQKVSEKLCSFKIKELK